MKFQSIKEYFYKLNTIGFILLLMPLVAFIFLYYLPVDRELWVPERQQSLALLGIFLALYLVGLTVVNWWFREKMRSMTKVIELARKMDKFSAASIKRMLTYCGFSLLMAVGFFLTSDSLFTGLFLFIALVMLIHWPSRTSFCRGLGLQGGERDMVLHNLDLYQKKRRA